MLSNVIVGLILIYLIVSAYLGHVATTESYSLFIKDPLYLHLSKRKIQIISAREGVIVILLWPFYLFKLLKE